MSTPVATIADALIAFILSLLRDPSAVEEFAAAPKAMLANNGLGDACAADVRAVKPVIVDHASVAARTVQTSTPPPQGNPGNPDQHSVDPDPVIHEIQRIINQFTSIVTSRSLSMRFASSPAATASSPEATTASWSKICVTSPPSVQMFWFTDWSTRVARLSMVNWLTMRVISRITSLAGSGGVGPDV